MIICSAAGIICGSSNDPARFYASCFEILVGLCVMIVQGTATMCFVESRGASTGAMLSFWIEKNGIRCSVYYAV